MIMKDTSSRTSLLNAMLIKAWKERWTDSQWGINIKTVLPRGVSGDVYNLADCILQQAVIGSNANQLALSYLKHSLCAHLISHAAVLKRISKYDDFDKIYCVAALLDFLNSIINGVTCRGKPEESILPSALASLIYWLMRVITGLLEIYKANSQFTNELTLLNKTTEVIDKITKNDFLLGIVFIGKQEDLDFYEKIINKNGEIKTLMKSLNLITQYPTLEEQINLLTIIDVDHLDMTKLDSKRTESITYCVQPLFSIVILLNPTSETQLYVAQLLMVQRLKNYSQPRLFYEIFRAGFISLSSSDTSHDAMWSALTFMKMPHILKQIHSFSSQSKEASETLDHIPDVIEAFEMILDETSILDFIDTKCERNFIESLLKEWAKQHIVNEMHIQMFASKREPISILPKREVSTQAQSIINFVPCAEVPLSGILKTLSTDYNKVHEALFGVLCQVLMGNSFDLILSVATVEGRLKTFVSRLIKCNENSKQVPGETGKPAMVRSTLFDVSFLMLTFIVQTYGSNIVLSENGESFFEKWVRECMVERNKMKSPRNMVALCDGTIVDELLLVLSKPDGQLKNSNTTWQDICMNIPGVLYQVLVAWENQTLSSTDVKRILDSIKRRPFSYSICAASYLCAYIQTVREDEILKPLNMVQQFLSSPNAEEMSPQHQEHIKERLGLTFQIIRKMQHDIHPTGNAKIRNLTQNIVSNSPLEEQFRDVWKGVVERGWLPIKLAQILESLLQACGPVWLVTRLVDEILKCKYTRDMTKMMDIVFAVMHLDMERNTIALLDNVIPQFLINKQHEPQSSILARLCVYCIISNMESSGNSISITYKKRSRPDELDDPTTTPGNTGTTPTTPKIRKLNSDNSGDSCSSDFVPENITNSTTSNKELPINVKEPLQTSLQAIFKTFGHFVANDELSPRIYFIFQFISLLVECGRDRVKSILKLLPNNLVQNLLKVMATDEIKVGLICRLYDLRSTQGRQAAISDLCLLRNIRMRKQSINL